MRWFLGDPKNHYVQFSLLVNYFFFHIKSLSCSSSSPYNSFSLGLLGSLVLLGAYSIKSHDFYYNFNPAAELIRLCLVGDDGYGCSFGLSNISEVAVGPVCFK